MIAGEIAGSAGVGIPYSAIPGIIIPDSRLLAKKTLVLPTRCC
jgi:hypothetical protein